MENVYLFAFVAFGYIWTDPNPLLANFLFMVFTVSRVLHTCVYAIFITPQPIKGRAWLVGYFITGFMALKTLLHFC